MVIGRSSAGLLLALALAILLLPLQWVAAAVLAAAFHEFCHYAAVRMCGGQIDGLYAGFSGFKMKVRMLSLRQEFLCALAGPSGSIFLLLFAKWLPRTAICAGFQGLYNLLPVYPLDGGRALRCAAELCLPTVLANRLCIVMEWICLVGIVLMGMYGCFVLHLGILPLLGAIWMVARTTQGKIPCKL